MKSSASWSIPGGASGDGLTLIDDLLGEQQSLTAVERFARAHDRHELPALETHYRRLLPGSAPKAGEQYAFEVDLDKCSGCKACVSACHSLNGLDEHETWRSVGLLVSVGDDVRSLTSKTASNQSLLTSAPMGVQQHVTTACHHCVDPGCLNGCPVLAYDKDPVTGIVRHLDDQCIGCSYCIMKCPYEVPKYSDRLGIVRKCDMCAKRLAVGEAPACVQACPHEAIRITLVETALVRDFRISAIAANLTGKGAKGKRRENSSSLSSCFESPGHAGHAGAPVSTPALGVRTPKADEDVGAPVQGKLTPPTMDAPRGHEPARQRPGVRQPSAALVASGRPEAAEARRTPRPCGVRTIHGGAESFSANPFLPDSPDPAITLPTTRYVSQRGLPQNVVAADAEALRLDHAHWPLVIMLVLTQAAAGLLLGATVLAFLGDVSLKPLGIAGFALLVLGLNAAVLHLGQPLKAWRAFLGWRTSWLSREIILFNVFAGATTAALAALWIPQLQALAPWLMAGAAGAGLVGVFASAMVYVDTGRRLWSSRMVFGNFFGSTLALGAALAAAVPGWTGQPSRSLLWAAILLSAGLFVWRQIEWRVALADEESPHHFGARVIRELLSTIQSGRTVLFLVSLGLMGMALVNAAHRGALWAGLAAAALLGAEFAGRYVFFVAAAGKRMPGGVAA